MEKLLSKAFLHYLLHLLRGHTANSQRSYKQSFNPSELNRRASNHKKQHHQHIIQTTQLTASKNRTCKSQSYIVCTRKPHAAFLSLKFQIVAKSSDCKFAAVDLHKQTLARGIWDAIKGREQKKIRRAKARKINRVYREERERERGGESRSKGPSRGPEGSQRESRKANNSGKIYIPGPERVRDSLSESQLASKKEEERYRGAAGTGSGTESESGAPRSFFLALVIAWNGTADHACTLLAVADVVVVHLLVIGDETLRTVLRTFSSVILLLLLLFLLLLQRRFLFLIL